MQASQFCVIFLVLNLWENEGAVIHLFVANISFRNTRSYAALRAADLDWIVGPGYSLGRVHSGEKPWKPTKNHEKP